MTKKQEKRHKKMKRLKEYIMKDKNFTILKEWKDKDGYIGYLFIMGGNFYYIYEEKDGVFIQHKGPVYNNPFVDNPYYEWIKKEK